MSTTIYRLRTHTMGSSAELDEGKHVIVIIPAGGIIALRPDGAPEGEVTVSWQNRLVHIFERDLEEKGERVASADSAS